MSDYQLTDASQSEFVAWLERCDPQRMFVNVNSKCPLACFLREAVGQSTARVGRFDCFPTGDVRVSFDIYPLPEWCKKFIQAFDELALELQNASNARIIYGRIADVDR